MLIFFSLNAFHSLLNVELTDFAILYAVSLINNRVSKFMECFYIILLCCAIKVNFMLHLALLHVVSQCPPLLFGAALSGLAISILAIWCHVVHSRDVSPRKFDRLVM